MTKVNRQQRFPINRNLDRGWKFASCWR